MTPEQMVRSEFELVYGAEDICVVNMVQVGGPHARMPPTDGMGAWVRACEGMHPRFRRLQKTHKVVHLLTPACSPLPPPPARPRAQNTRALQPLVDEYNKVQQSLEDYLDMLQLRLKLRKKAEPQLVGAGVCVFGGDACAGCCWGRLQVWPIAPRRSACQERAEP